MNPRKYLSFTRVGLREGLQYRTDALASVGTTVFYLALMYYVWLAIASSGTLNSSFERIIAYIALGQVIQNSTTVDLESWVGDRVRKGTIVNELKKPVAFNLQLYFYQLGETAFNVIGRGLPALLIGVAFLGVGFPGVSAGLQFLASLFLSLNLAITLSYAVSMLVFWTKVGWSLRMMRSLVTGLFSGAMFPLYLLPDGLRGLFQLTPFPSMVDGPISIYQGTAESTLTVLGIQVFWIVLLGVLGELLWRRARRKLTVQGG